MSQRWRWPGRRPPAARPAAAASCCPAAATWTRRCTGRPPRGATRPIRSGTGGKFLAEGKPILGICRGAQVIAAALGGSLLQHVEGHDRLDGVDRLHETRTAGLLLRLYGPEAVVNSAHHQAIDCLPPDCRLLQISVDGVVEAFCHNTLPVLGVQWHPERLCGQFARPDAVNGLPLLRAFLGLCGGCA